ncbi:MAG: glycosyltransferase family 2 protein [Enterocloster sp.]
MGMVKVSIVTVCRNSQQVIAKTIESVLNQSYGSIEYIIVDGHSQDKTLDIIRSYETVFLEKGYDYRVISEDDEGIYDAMNKGIRLAHGELVGLINSGDWYELQAVQRVVETYENTPFDMFYADLRIWRNGKAMIKRARLRRFVTTRDWNHPTTFIRRELYQLYHYACIGIYDDWDLVLQIRRAGYKVVVLNEMLADFCFGGVSNEKNIKAAFARMCERYRIYRKNGFSRLYLFECILMETVKHLAA